MIETKDMSNSWWWVSKVIMSCKNDNHINSTKRLIQNFDRRFKNSQLTKGLQDTLDYKIKQLYFNK